MSAPRVASKRYKLGCAPIIGSNQPAHLHCLIRIFNECPMGSQGSNVSRSGVKLRLRPDCAGVQTDFNLHCTDMTTEYMLKWEMLKM